MNSFIPTIVNLFDYKVDGQRQHSQHARTHPDRIYPGVVWVDAFRCKACEVPTRYRGRIFHDTRRSAVRFMVKAGVAPQVAKKISGHKTDAVFQRYSILNTDDLRDAQRRTEEYRETAAAQKPVVAIR